MMNDKNFYEEFQKLQYSAKLWRHYWVALKVFVNKYFAEKNASAEEKREA